MHVKKWVKIVRTGYILKESALSELVPSQKKPDKTTVGIVCEPDACKICQRHDGNIVLPSQGWIGINLPPFHPNCRCRTAPKEMDPWEAESYIWFQINDRENGVGIEQKAQLLMDYYGITHVPNQFMQRAVSALLNTKEIATVEDQIRVLHSVLENPVSLLSDPEFNKTSIKTTHNGWMDLYDRPTVAGAGRDIVIPSEFEKDWYAFEVQSDVNPQARRLIGDGTQVFFGSKGEMTDFEKRYWVGVGPNVMNPAHKPSEEITPDEMKYGSKLDVVLEDAEGNLLYLPCVVGEAKAHTYPNGIFQTGYIFPNGEEFVPDTGGNGAIEFMGEWLEEGMNDYKLRKIIVYDS